MNAISQICAGENVLIWLSRAPTQKRDRLLLYNFEDMFLMITFKKYVRVFSEVNSFCDININYIYKYWLRPILIGNFLKSMWSLSLEVGAWSNLEWSNPCKVL